MPRIDGMSNRQSRFLRALAKSEGGKIEMNWPSPGVLRRWMRRPRFIRAMIAIRKALHYRSDFELAGVAASAGSQLSTLLTSNPSKEQRTLVQAMANLIKLSHMRQRFPGSEEPQVDCAIPNILSILATVHPSVSANRAYELITAMLEARAEKTDEDRQDILDYAKAKKALGSKLSREERDGDAF